MVHGSTCLLEQKRHMTHNMSGTKREKIKNKPAPVPQPCVLDGDGDRETLDQQTSIRDEGKSITCMEKSMAHSISTMSSKMHP